MAHTLKQYEAQYLYHDANDKLQTWFLPISAKSLTEATRIAKGRVGSGFHFGRFAKVYEKDPAVPKGDALQAKWNAIAAQMIPVGSVVKAVQYMDDEELRDSGFTKRPVTIWIQTPDGKPIALFPQRDDEGNDAGALGMFSPAQLDHPILPTL